MSQTESSPLKFIAGIGGALCWAIAGILVLNIGAGNSANGCVFIIFALVLFVVGIVLFQAAWDADEKYAKNMELKSAAKSAEVEYRKKQLELEKAREIRTQELKLEAERRKTEEQRLELERREYQLRQNLADAAEQKGLDVNSVIGINSHKYIKEIDLHVRAQEKEMDLKAYEKEKEIDFKVRQMDKQLEIQTEAEQTRHQLDAADRVEHYRLIGHVNTRNKLIQ
jgi:hypothetical protein